MGRSISQSLAFIAASEPGHRYAMPPFEPVKPVRGTLVWSKFYGDSSVKRYSAVDCDNICKITRNSSHKQAKKIASTCLSLVLSSILFLGNFDLLIDDAHFLQNKAAALESVSTGPTHNTEGESWPPTSDQDLFKTQSSKRNRPKRYWDVMQHGTADEISAANEKLIDSAVATINTMYYDSSGGYAFDPKTFYDKWKNIRYLARNGESDRSIPIEHAFTSRESTVNTLKWLVSSINDPYSKYLTREELTQELVGGDDGFLGLGALVDVPSTVDNEVLKWSLPEKKPDWNSILNLNKISSRNQYGQWDGVNVSVDEVLAAFAKREISVSNQIKPKSKEILTTNQASNLPVIKAIVPDSPAERAGLVVGDRIASVGTYQFTGMSLPQVRKSLDSKFHAQNYFGEADLTVAKPILAAQPLDAEEETQEKYVFEDGWYQPKKPRPRVYQNRRSQEVIAFKLSHVKSIPTTLTAGAFKLDNLRAPNPSISTEVTTTELQSQEQPETFPSVIGGDAIVHYATLTSNDSIFQTNGARPVGYIRLTRFSKASTAGYINAINSLEAAGVDSYIIDIRNNYGESFCQSDKCASKQQILILFTQFLGGVIQEAMLTAVSLCFILTSSFVYIF